MVRANPGKSKPSDDLIYGVHSAPRPLETWGVSNPDMKQVDSHHRGVLDPMARFLQAWRSSQTSSQDTKHPGRLMLAGLVGIFILEGMIDWHLGTGYSPLQGSQLCSSSLILKCSTRLRSNKKWSSTQV